MGNFNFLLKNDVTYLNHGSRGACLEDVFFEYQNWQLRLEEQPCEYFRDILPKAMKDTRETLANFLGASGDEIAFLPNPTFAINAIAQTIKLEKGDEVLSSDQEYGACVNTWKTRCKELGAQFIERKNFSSPRR